MKASGSLTGLKDWGPCATHKAIGTKDNGKRTIRKDWEWKHGHSTTRSMSEISRAVKKVDTGIIGGMMAASTRATSRMGYFKARAHTTTQINRKLM